MEGGPPCPPRLGGSSDRSRQSFSDLAFHLWLPFDSAQGLELVETAALPCHVIFVFLRGYKSSASSASSCGKHLSGEIASRYGRNGRKGHNGLGRFQFYGSPSRPWRPWREGIHLRLWLRHQPRWVPSWLTNSEICLYSHAKFAKDAKGNRQVSSSAGPLRPRRPVR